MTIKITKNNRRVGDGTPGPGRPKGSSNKFTRGAREAIQCAFTACGGVEALAQWAKANRTEFYRLYARLIPVEQRHGGPNGELAKFTVEFVQSAATAE